MQYVLTELINNGNFERHINRIRRKIRKDKQIMEPRDYIVTKIEGEYAYLRPLDANSEDEIFIALALLPLGVDTGTKLHCELFSYTIIE